MTYNEKPSSEREYEDAQKPASEERPTEPAEVPTVENTIEELSVTDEQPAPNEQPVTDEQPTPDEQPVVGEQPTPSEQPVTNIAAAPSEFVPKKDRKHQKPKKQYRISGVGIAFLLVLCLSVSVFTGAAIGILAGGNRYAPPPVGEETADTPHIGDNNTSTAPVKNTETAPVIGGFSDEPIASGEFSEVAEKAWRSVVVIRVTNEQSAGAGAGVIYDKNGYIVTNYHVVGKDTKTISVELSDGSVYDARFIYGDDLADISVIKIEKNDCIPATFGNSEQMTIATPVFAIGNPLGKGLRITNGIITAPESEETIDNITMTLMNTNAAINSGNSGGGLFNMNGELIGIVNAKIGGTSVEGFGFAIPSSTILHCIKDLNEKGYVTGRARLGVSVEERTVRYGSSWFFANTFTICQIKSIQADGSSAGSGLQAGDILYEIDGVEISSFSVLQRILTKNKVGDTVTLTVKRPTVALSSDGSNFQDFWNAAEEVKLTITFVEFKPAG